MQAFKQEIVHVGDSTYVITPFLTSKGLRIKSKLVKYLGASLSQAMSQSESEEEGNDASIIEILANVFTEVSEDQYVELIRDILSNVTKNNMPIDFEQEFALNYANLFKLVKEVLQYNYKDLFQLLGINVN